MMNTFFLAVFIASATLPLKSLAYPPVEYQACLKTATNSVVQKGIAATLNQVAGYCDCALRKIIDEGKEIRSSIAICEAAHF